MLSSDAFPFQFKTELLRAKSSQYLDLWTNRELERVVLMLELHNTPETCLVAVVQDGNINASSTTTPTVWLGWLVQPSWGRGNKATTERGWRGFVMLSKCYKGFYCHLLGKCLTLDSDGVLLSWRYLSTGINQDLFYWRAGAWSQSTKQLNAPRVPFTSAQNHHSPQPRGSAGETEVQRGVSSCLQGSRGRTAGFRPEWGKDRSTSVHITPAACTSLALYLLQMQSTQEPPPWHPELRKRSQAGPIKRGQSHHARLVPSSWSHQGRLVPHKHTVISAL